MAAGRGTGRVTFVGDASSVKKAARESEAAINRLNAAGEKSMSRIGSAAKAAAVGGVAILGVSMVKFGKDAAKAALEAEASMAKTKRMVEAAGLSWEKYGEQIDKASQAAVKKGFDDEQAAESIGNLIRVTKDSSEAIRLNAIAMDVARGRGMELDAATNLVIKAHNGQTGALTRLGIQIDKHATGQQAVAALQKQFAGQADAYGKTTAGAADKLRASWENFQESVGQKLLPVLANLMNKLSELSVYLEQHWPQAWAAIRKYAEPVLAWLGPFAKNVFGIVKNAIALIVNLLQGDWPQAWGNLKKVVSNALSGLGKLAGLALDVGVTLGKNIGRGLGNAMLALVEWSVNKALAGINKVSGVLNAVIPGGDPLNDNLSVKLGRIGASSTSSGTYNNGAGVGLASGGVVPGPRGAGDVVPAMLTPGEVVLNRGQQAMLGVNRIMNVLHVTGGKIGMGAFASGGVAATAGAMQFAKSQLGEPYVWGAGHSYGDSRGWDCSGFASNVAARVPGYKGGIGTTMSLYPRSKPARGDEPVVFGFLGMNQSNPAKQHMGIRINGQWFEAAGRRGVIRGRSNWPSGLRVPAGLEYLALGAGGVAGVEGGNPSSSQAPDAPSPAVRKAIDTALKGVGSFAAAPTSMSDTAQQAISAAATAAGRDVLTRTGDPDAAREAMDDAQRTAEQAEVRRELADASRERRQLYDAIAKVKKRWKAAAKAVPKSGAGRATALKVVAALRAKVVELNNVLAGLNAWIGELNARALELDIAAAEDAQQPSAADSVATDTVSASALADVQAQLAQAQQIGATATAGQLAADDFIRTAFGPGDISRRGATAWQAAGGTVNITIQALAANDPTVLQTILAAIARAGNLGPAVSASVTAVTA